MIKPFDRVTSCPRLSQFPNSLVTANRLKMTIAGKKAEKIKTPAQKVGPASYQS